MLIASAGAVQASEPARTAPQPNPCPPAIEGSNYAAGSAPTLLYLWSPRMVLSVTQAGEIAKAAAAEGLRFAPLLDPRVPFAEAQAALDQQQTGAKSAGVLNACVTAQSAQFALEDWHHAPTMRLWINQRLHGRRIVGVMPAAALRALLRERMAQ